MKNFNIISSDVIIAIKDLRLFIRYDGYQFTVSEKTIIKELYKQGK